MARLIFFICMIILAITGMVYNGMNDPVAGLLTWATFTAGFITGNTFFKHERSN